MTTKTKTSMLDKLKAMKAKKEEELSKSQGGNGEDEAYTIQNLSNKDYWLGKLPKDPVATGVVSEDGEVDGKSLETAMQRVMFKSMETLGAEMLRSIEASMSELKGYVDERVQGTERSFEEKDISFYEGTDAQSRMKNLLAKTEYEKLKGTYPDASVADLQAATLEIVNRAVTTGQEQEEEEAADDAPLKGFEDLLDGFDLDTPDTPEAEGSKGSDVAGQSNGDA